MAGSLNWAIVIVFEDGVECIFRSPRSGRHGIVNEKSASKMLASEVVTLKYIRSHSSIPAPEVFAYRYQVSMTRSVLLLTWFSATRENAIGIPYILMSKASGRPRSEFEWLTQ